MPAKNKVKVYGENCFYHAYNRGYNKQDIFRDDDDYKNFLYLLKKYLDPEFLEKRKDANGVEYLLPSNHVYKELNLLSFCLMPNHFHFLIHQSSIKGMTKFIVRVSSNFATYFNKKYGTFGSPFQGTYKAVSVKSEEQLVHLSRYIHLNPFNPEEYPYSSYSWYLNGGPAWLKPEKILGTFKSPESYKNFVNSSIPEQKEREMKDLLLDRVRPF